jgi:hypothetical protein
MKYNQNLKKVKNHWSLMHMLQHGKRKHRCVAPQSIVYRGRFGAIKRYAKAFPFPTIILHIIREGFPPVLRAPIGWCSEYHELICREGRALVHPLYCTYTSLIWI